MNAEKRNGELALSDAPRSLVGRDTKIFVVVANSCVMSWASHFLLRQRRDVGVNSKLMIHFLPNLFEKSPWRQLRSRPPSVRIRVRPLLKIRGLTMSAVRVVRRQSPAVTTFAPRTRRRRRRRPPPHDTALLLLAARPPPPLFPSLPPCRSRRAGGAVVSFARVNKLTFQNTSGREERTSPHHRVGSGSPRTHPDWNLRFMPASCIPRPGGVVVRPHSHSPSLQSRRRGGGGELCALCIL